MRGRENPLVQAGEELAVAFRELRSGRRISANACAQTPRTILGQEGAWRMMSSARPLAEHPFMHVLNLHLKVHPLLRRDASVFPAWNVIAI